MRYFAIFFVLYIIGCATIPAPQQQAHMWVGHHINEVIQQWGAAQESLLIPNGNRIYVYKRYYPTGRKLSLNIEMMGLAFAPPEQRAYWLPRIQEEIDREEKRSWKIILFETDMHGRILNHSVRFTE